jgi:hypothetical protein
MYSSVETCRLNGVDPFAYLEDVLIRVRETGPKASRIWHPIAAQRTLPGGPRNRWSSFEHPSSSCANSGARPGMPSDANLASELGFEFGAATAQTGCTACHAHDRREPPCAVQVGFEGRLRLPGHECHGRIGQLEDPARQ